MHFDESHISRLFGQVPYARLANLSSAKELVRAMVRDGKELDAVFRQFPSLKYEPLDQHYVLMKCLGVVGEELIADLCTHYTWRGVVWASWVCALTPNVAYRKHLMLARHRLQRGEWLVDLALSEVDGITWAGDPEMQVLTRQLGAMLSRVPIEKSELKRRPSESEVLVSNAERIQVAHAYRTGGATAALAVIQQSMAFRRGGQN